MGGGAQRPAAVTDDQVTIPWGGAFSGQRRYIYIYIYIERERERERKREHANPAGVIKLDR